jgi:carboxyl-terminal processing protease
MICATRRIFFAQAALGLTLAGCHSATQRSRLAIFDTMWRTVDEWFFDPAMEGVDWNAVRREWRPRAARAETPAVLYLEVLAPVLDQFRTSHLEIRPPGMLTLSNGRFFTPPRQRAGRPVLLSPEDEAGMGAVLTFTGSAFLVEDVTVDAPAQEAGLRPGQSVRIASLSLPETGRTVQLVDSVSGTRFDVTWSPKAAPSPTEWRELPDGTGYLRFNAFDPPAVTWVIKTLQEAKDRPVVLDLRQNGGGLIAEMVRLASGLLPAATALGDFKGRKRDYRLRTAREGKVVDGPLAVLVGPRTGSCAEVTAAALRHYGRAQLFGSPTAGAVLASQIFDLPDGGTLMVPYLDYIDLSGERIEGRGVTPDVLAPRTARSFADRSDPAIDAAMSWLRSGQ